MRQVQFRKIFETPEPTHSAVCVPLRPGVLWEDTIWAIYQVTVSGVCTLLEPSVTPLCPDYSSIPAIAVPKGILLYFQVVLLIFMNTISEEHLEGVSSYLPHMSTGLKDELRRF